MVRRPMLILLSLLLLLASLSAWRLAAVMTPGGGGRPRGGEHSRPGLTLERPPTTSVPPCDLWFNASGHQVPGQACTRCTSPLLVALASDGVRLCRCLVGCKHLPAWGTTRPSAPQRTWSEADDAQAVASRGVRLVFGLGTGRCGTVTLHHVLRSQPGCGATVSHELHPVLPWTPGSREKGAQLVASRVRQLLARAAAYSRQDGGAGPVPLVADVGSSYLPHVRSILALEPGARFLVLQRARGEVVRSFLAKDKGVDLWSSCAQSGNWSAFTRYWAGAHPKIPCPDGQGPDQERSLGGYWDLYAATVAQLATEFPDRVRMWPSPRVFHDAAMQAEMLAWVGVAKPRVQGRAPRHNCVASCGKPPMWGGQPAGGAAGGVMTSHAHQKIGN
jgi:hypothetical protein